MGEFSVVHLLVLAVILLVVFGPSRLPGLGQSIGKAIRGFKDGLSETTNDINNEPAQRTNQQIPPVDQAPNSAGSHSQASQAKPEVKKTEA